MDFTGCKIGKLTVIKRAEYKIGRDGQKIIQWECQCECGKVVFRRSHHIKRGRCSCVTCKATEEAKRFGFKGIRQHHWYSIKKQAEKRGIPFKLTMEDAWDLFEKQNHRCALSGISIGFATNRKEHLKGGTTASLDRIDSSRGYTKDNVQWLHKWVNLMKSDFDQGEFLNYCQIITEYAYQKEKVKTTD